MMGKARVRTFSGNIKDYRRKKIVHKDGTKISTFTFLTLDVDIANDVFKRLINVRCLSEYLKKHLGNKNKTLKYNKTPNSQQHSLIFSFCQATTWCLLKNLRRGVYLLCRKPI